jgi:hypothetical protein
MNAGLFPVKSQFALHMPASVLHSYSKSAGVTLDIYTHAVTSAERRCPKAKVVEMIVQKCREVRRAE